MINCQPYDLEQKGEMNGASSITASTKQFMEPRPYAALNMNEPSVSDHGDNNKTHEEKSVSPATTPEVMSKESENPRVQIPSGKQTKMEDGGHGDGDQTSQNGGSPRSPMLGQSQAKSTEGEQVTDQTQFRKARVSVRARSEAPIVRK